MRTLTTSAGLAALVCLGACSEPTADRAARPAGRPASLAVASAPCPANPTVVVSDEASLTAALAAARPGNVIALSAFFPVTADIVIAVPNVVLTCATPGAGLLGASAAIDEMVWVQASGVVVDRLLLDASGVSGDPYFGDNAFGVQLTNNVVTCSPGSCALFIGTQGAVVANNQFRSAGSFTGVHMQAGIDSSRVEGNTIVATAPSTNFPFGGIRVRDGSNVIVANNVVQGPWQTSIAPTNVRGSRFESNRLTGALVNGIRFTISLPLAMADNAFRTNLVSGAGSAGIFAQLACRNIFVGNNLQGNAGNIGAFFNATTGANILLGNNNVVIDNGGGFDCDGDGVGDRNAIAGPGLVGRGGRAGPPDTLSSVVSRHGITIK
jgi:parallel beta helix pectate lyase-like protein